MNDLIMEERNRIKKIIDRKIGYVINKREQNKKKRYNKVGFLQKLWCDIFFLIDNPDYVRTTDYTKDDEGEDDE